MKPHASRLAGLLLSAVPLFNSPALAQSEWKVGEPLPHIHLPTLEGIQEVDLAAFRGTKVLLIEFASW